MPSQIADLEYDVFVSYRQSDNKFLAGGQATVGWVSEFVANLNLELESIVKSKVSIYFDENPHDGLLETHDVDASLSSKLRSLIFIPILSQTYCDPESFAWQKEFHAFNKMAGSDKYGPTIKLANGNISNRVLPVRIYDLDTADIKMFEAEINARLRPIDFIFKSPGVNRPLRANEEDPLKNTNHTFYRDQINKTAQAVKDIINGLKYSESNSAKPYKAKFFEPQKANKVRSQQGTPSIAVLPFYNLSKDLDQEFLSDGLPEVILNSFIQLKDLKVAPRSSSFSFRGEKVNTRDVGEKLKVSAILEGTLLRQSDKLLLNVYLRSTEDGSVIWSEKYDRKMSDVFVLLTEIILKASEKLRLTLTKKNRESISKQYTSNPVAFERYLHGQYYLNRQGDGLLKSITYYQEATELDPKFALAFASLARAYILLGYFDLVNYQEVITKSKDAALKALEIDCTLIEAYNALAFVNMGYELNWPEAEQYFIKIFAINPDHPSARDRYKLYLEFVVNNLKEAESEMVTAPYYLRAYALLHRGKFEEALKVGQEAVGREPDSFMAQRAVGLSYMGLEMYEQATAALLAARRLSNEHRWLSFELMGAYTMVGKIEEAQAIMEEVLAQSNLLPDKIHNFFFPAQYFVK